MNRWFLLGVGCLAVCVGCSSSPGESGKDSDVAATGTEGNPCYGNKTCNEGLTCASSLCVRLNETLNDGGDTTDDLPLRDGYPVDGAPPPDGTHDHEIVDAIVGQDTLHADGPIDAVPIDVIVPHDAEVTSPDAWQPPDLAADLPVDVLLVDAPKDISTDSGVIDVSLDTPIDTSTIDTLSDANTDLPIPDTAKDTALDIVLDIPTPDGTQDAFVDMPLIDTANDTTTDTLKDSSGTDTKADISLDIAVDTSQDIKPIECPAGYILSDTTCIDIDECAQGTHTCTGTSVCKNDEGTFSCVCPIGEHYCNGTCLPTDIDPNNCGGCGKKCLQPASCTDGKCVDTNCDQAILVPTQYKTLQDAINAASNGATICVMPGTYGFSNVTKQNISVRAYPGGTKPKLAGISSIYSYTLVGFQIEVPNQSTHIVQIPGGELAYNTIVGQNCVSSLTLITSSKTSGGDLNVHHNDLRGCVGEGLRFEISSSKSSSRTVTVENNIISGGRPIYFADIENSNGVKSRQYGSITYNTLGGTYQSQISVSVDNRFLVIDNNIFTNTATAIAFSSLCEVPPCVTNVNHNLFWNTTVTGDVAYGIGNIFDDPKLLWNPKGGCPALDPDSPAIDAAGSTYPFEDFYRASRPVDGDGNGVNTADIGCYEYTP